MSDQKAAKLSVIDEAADFSIQCGMTLDMAVRTYKMRVIEMALRRTMGRRGKAARILKTHRNTLTRALIEYPLPLASDKAYWRKFTDTGAKPVSSAKPDDVLRADTA
jgi:DNA-binding NtrC family response regulator